jgi:hypothetical protein
MAEGATASASRENRRAIPVSCALRQGPRGFANLVVERKRDGEIVLDVHVTGACVIILDETPRGHCSTFSARGSDERAPSHAGARGAPVTHVRF